LSAILSLNERSLEDSLVSLAENMRLNREVNVGFFGGPAGRASPLTGDLEVEAGREDWELIEEAFEGITEGDSP
jgi:hypothetical protein